MGYTPRMTTRKNPHLIDRRDIVGAAEIAARLISTKTGQPVPRDTVNTWHKRRRAWLAEGAPTRRAGTEPMPAPLTFDDGTPITVSGEPVWLWPEIAEWATRAGRYQIAWQRPTG